MPAPQKITRAYCVDKTLLFHPATPDEARFIQERLFEMGFKWREGQEHPLYLDELATGTLQLSGGALSRGTDRSYDGTVCNIKQLDAKYLSPDQQFVQDLFNKISARLDSIDERLTAIEAVVAPSAPLDKKKFQPKARGRST